MTTDSIRRIENFLIEAGIEPPAPEVSYKDVRNPALVEQAAS